MAACLLWPLSIVFRVLVFWRRVLYRIGILKSVRMPVTLVVVGNVFIGGTGKTPFTIWLVNALRQAGYTPGVVSRGHGARHDEPQAVTQESLPHQVGDEPVLIAQRARCPLVVGRDRVAAAQTLLASYPQVDVIVSDDGLQHYALQRDVEIVMFDARGAGNGWLLPAGPLREPISRRRDFTVENTSSVTRVDGAVPMRLQGNTAERLDSSAPPMALDDLKASTQRIVAAAGIGHPERFFAMLRELGLRFDALPLPDHFAFDETSFAGIQADLILMTEKDAVKCRHIAALRDDARLWVVPVTAQIDAALADKIAEKVAEKLRGRTIA
jgi:tetraacyldisaccharide 4'-kinase